MNEISNPVGVRLNALLSAAALDPLSETQTGSFEAYFSLLHRWNARINLTAIRNEEEIVTRHFGESFFLARHLFPASVAGAPLIAHFALSGTPSYPRVLDIGSGAGFPALPLKLWAPHIHLTLIESNHKKAVFLREVARALTLTNIDVLTGRVQALAASLSSQADVVTLRAVERLEAILPQAVTFLAAKGTLALLITTPQVPQVLTQTNLKWEAQINVPKSRSRVLLIGYQA